MEGPGPRRWEIRRCPGCASPLAADNAGRLCGRCHREQRDQLRTPPTELRDGFFETPEFREAFASQHIGKVFKAYRSHSRHRLFGTTLTQELLGRWLGLTQAQVSRIENGRPEHNIETLRNYARILHLPRHLLWFEPAPGHDPLITAAGMDTLELLRRLRASAVDPATVDALDITVEQLCCDYAHADARELIATGRTWLNRMTELLADRLTLAQHRDVLRAAGRLALLVGCLEYDLGDARSAEPTRRMALSLGEESGDPGIVGWAHEMRAWFHLTTGNHRAVLTAADAGIAAAPSRSVAVQLHGQQAKAYARMGLPEQVHAALERGRALLDTLPYPTRPDDHFVVDPDKWDFYAMDTYRIVGEDELAERNAEEVIRRATAPDGVVIAPMRRAEAELTLAVVAARRGDVEGASTLGVRALRAGRRSRPSLLMVAAELDRELRAAGPAAGSDFRDLLRHVKGESGGGSQVVASAADPMPDVQRGVWLCGSGSETCGCVHACSGVSR
jgi:transcriptional regulator with XRE-family HTH domain